MTGRQHHKKVKRKNKPTTSIVTPLPSPLVGELESAIINEGLLRGYDMTRPEYVEEAIREKMERTAAEFKPWATDFIKGLRHRKKVKG